MPDFTLPHVSEVLGEEKKKTQKTKLKKNKKNQNKNQNKNLFQIAKSHGKGVRN